MKDRPYRKTTDCIVVDVATNRVLAQDRGHYLAFPGGGIDAGETAEAAGRREIREEVGYEVLWMQGLIDLKWDWYPEWANTEKRKERYKKFRGEHIYILIGQLGARAEEGLIEKDKWEGELFMDLKEAVALADKFLEEAHPNEEDYKHFQLLALQCMLEEL